MPPTKKDQQRGGEDQSILSRAPSSLLPEELVQYTKAMYERLSKRDAGLRTIREGYIDLYNNNFPTKIIVNYIKPTVKKWAVYLLGKKVKFNVSRETEMEGKELTKAGGFTLAPGEDVNTYMDANSKRFGKTTTELQQLEDFAQDILDATMEKEKLHAKLFNAAIDTFVVGAWGIKVYFDKDAGIVRYTKVNPLNLHVEYRRNDADDPIRVMHVYQMDILAAREKFGMPNLQPSQLQGSLGKDDYDVANASAYVTIYEMEDYLHQEHWLVAGSDVVVPVETIKLPSFICQPNGYRPNGIGLLGESVVTEMASLNISMCEDLWTFRRLTRANAYPMYKTWGPVDLRNWVPTENSVIPLGKKRGETDIEPLSLGVNTFPLKDAISTSLSMLHDISMMPDAAFGNFNASITSSVAMQTQLSPTLSVAESLKLQWETPLRKIAKLTLELYALYGSKQFDVLKKWYDTRKKDGGMGFDVTIKWPNVTPTDDVQHINNELTKFKSGMQSYITTMENLGIENPVYEMRLRLAEVKDPVTNPTLLQQLTGIFIQALGSQTQANIQTLAQQARAQIPQQGGAPAQPGQAPQPGIPEGQTAPEPGGMDMAAQQASAEQENQALLSGGSAEVSPSDVHEVHISIHNKALRSAPGDARAAIQAHVTAHQEAMAGAPETPAAPQPEAPVAAPPGVPMEAPLGGDMPQL